MIFYFFVLSLHYQTRTNNNKQTKKIMKELRQAMEFKNKNNEVHRVYCTRLEFLFLKLHYGKDGLTEQEYREYKQL